MRRNEENMISIEWKQGHALTGDIKLSFRSSPRILFSPLLSLRCSPLLRDINKVFNANEFYSLAAARLDGGNGRAPCAGKV
jgi:hypothetical protein